MRMPRRGPRAGAQSVEEFLILRPVRDELRSGSQGCDERLRGGHAGLGACVERQHDLAGGREGRGRVVDEGDRQGPVVAPGLGEVEDIGAAARLGDGQEQRAAHARPGGIDGGHRWADGRGDEPGADLEQVFGEGRRIVGTAPGAGDSEGRRGRAQPCAEIPAEAGILSQKTRHDVRRLPCFPQHRRAGWGGFPVRLRHGASVCGCPMVSSATKS